MVAHSFILLTATLSFVSASIHQNAHHRRADAFKKRLQTPEPVQETSFEKRAPALTDGWVYHGCVKDSVSNRVLAKRQPDSNTLTANSCIAACSGFKYAGLEYGQECWCGDSLNEPSPLGEAKCNMACKGDASQKCGGADAVTVYSTNPKYSYTSLGCFTDTASPRTLSGYTFKATSMTPWKCQSTCNFRGFKFAGLEAGQQCFCASSVGYPTKASSADCSTACAGDSSKKCGGSWRIEVFGPSDTVIDSPSMTTTTPVSTATTASGTYIDIGCYSDQASPRTLTTQASGSPSTSQTVAKCNAKCLALGKPFAGTENGNECWCGSTLDDALEVDPAECTAACTGASGENCGGGWRLRVQYNADLDDSPCEEDD